MFSKPVSLCLALASVTLMACSQAISGPSFDCSKVTKSTEKAVCASENLSDLDNELARIYALVIDDPSLSPEDFKSLKASQIGWIKGRDDCYKGSDMNRCITSTYALRIHELRQRFKAARKMVRPMVTSGPLTLNCEGLNDMPAVTLFNTKEPLAIATWQNIFLVMPQVVAASGSKYETTVFGGATAMLWMKGEGARLTVPNDAEYDCTIMVNQ